MPADSRVAFVAGFRGELTARQFEEIVPSSEWSYLPQTCSSWPFLNVNQRRALVVLFDIYSERVFDCSRIGVCVRSLAEAGWKRLVRDLLVEGPKRRPLLPVNIMYSLYAAAAVARPDTCPMPAWTAIEEKERRRPPPHVDFITFVALLSAVAVCWRRGRATVAMAETSVEARSALPAMLHALSLSACAEADGEQRLSQRQVNRPSQQQGPKLRMWELMSGQGSEEEEQARKPATPARARMKRPSAAAAAGASVTAASTISPAQPLANASVEAVDVEAGEVEAEVEAADAEAEEAEAELTVVLDTARPRQPHPSAAYHPEFAGATRTPMTPAAPPGGSSLETDDGSDEASSIDLDTQLVNSGRDALAAERRVAAMGGTPPPPHTASPWLARAKMSLAPETGRQCNVRVGPPYAMTACAKVGSDASPYTVTATCHSLISSFRGFERGHSHRP